MIVDVHAHVFQRFCGRVADGPTRGLGYGRVSIGNASLQIMPPLCKQTRHTSEMLIAHMDWAGVDKAVLLQGPFYGECNEYVAKAVRSYPDRLVGAAYFDPWENDAHRRFDAVVANTSFRALKLEMSESTGFSGIHPGVTLSDPNLAWLWDELEKRKLVMVLDLGAVGSASYQTDAVRQIAEDHSDLKIVIAHLAQITPIVEAESELRQAWERQIDLGCLPNVWFDTASLPAYLAEEGYPYPSAARYIRTAIDRIGPTKVMWGTDIPGLLSHATYPQLRRAAEKHIAFLPADDQARIMGGTAIDVFG
ncbi:MAG: hypothetical protein A2Z18_03335 [Armatimonadetes bacterium RBG_16_58_9]|nr:MAG: hypothetical protein A2Z18_03335 [Armatimonadetes bacterium RBG_16_58_9]